MTIPTITDARAFFFDAAPYRDDDAVVPPHFHTAAGEDDQDPHTFDAREDADRDCEPEVMTVAVYACVDPRCPFYLPNA